MPLLQRQARLCVWTPPCVLRYCLVPVGPPQQPSAARSHFLPRVAVEKPVQSQPLDSLLHCQMVKFFHSGPGLMFGGFEVHAFPPTCRPSLVAILEFLAAEPAKLFREA